MKPIQNIRIHHTAIAPSFNRSLLNEVKGVQRWEFAPHFIHRSIEREIGYLSDVSIVNRVTELLHKGTLIEYHTMKGTRRVLIHNMDTGISVVADLDTKTVVSLWQNTQDDNHKTLKKSLYMFGG